MGTDRRAQVEEWQRVLDGTLTYLRVQAATTLPYSAVIRMERNAHRLSMQRLSQLGVFSGSDDVAPLLTDEVLSDTLEPESHTEIHSARILAGADSAPLDDGPEGVDDVTNRLMSDEADLFEIEVDIPAAVDPVEVEATAEVAVDDLLAEDDLDLSAELGLDEDEELVSTVGGDELDLVLGDLDEANADDVQAEDDDLDLLGSEEDEEEELVTAPPGTETPMPTARVSSDDLLTAPAIESAADKPGLLLGDFDDFDDDEEDQTVVFGLDSGNAAAELAALLEDDEDSATSPNLDTDDASDFVMEDEEEDDEAEEEADLELEEDAPTPTPAGVRVSAPTAAASVTAGLYGQQSNVPTIRESSERPKAAAIQINAEAGTGKVLGLEEEEIPLEIGAIEDYEEDYEEDEDAPSGGGFSLSLADDYDDDDEWEDEEEEEEEMEEEPPPPPEPAFQGPTAAQIRMALDEAKASAGRGDMQRGVDFYSDVIDADPDNIEAHVGRGRLFLDLGDYSRAMSDFMVAEDIAPGNPEPQVAIGDLYFARKDYLKAIDYFNQALSISPNHAMAFCRRGISHYYKKQYNEALDDLQQAEKLDEDIPNIGTFIGMARKKAKRR